MKEKINFNDVDVLVLFFLMGGMEGFFKEFFVFRCLIVFYGNFFNNFFVVVIEFREYFRDRLIFFIVVKSLEEFKVVFFVYDDMKDVFDRFFRVRIGFIGRVFFWLINEKLDIFYIYISFKKFYEYYEKIIVEEGWEVVKEIVENVEEIKELDREFFVKVGWVYVVIKCIFEDYYFKGFIVGCFDFIGKIGIIFCFVFVMFNV